MVRNEKESEHNTVNLEKFPQFLQSNFKSRNIEFPKETQWEFDQIYAFRCIKWIEGRNNEISLDDFLSQAECGTLPRWWTEATGNDPRYYGVSLFTEKQKIVNLFKLPKPTKKIAAGYVTKDGGPIYQEEGDSHITWWLYAGVKSIIEKNFLITEDENGRE